MSVDEGLPVGWALAPLAELLTGIETGKSFKCDERPPKTGEIGIVKVSAVSWGEYQEQESKTCLDDTRVNQALFVQSGDFLFSRANTIELVGACVIARQVSLRVMLSDKILRFKFISEAMKPWVLNLLRSRQGRLQIETLASGNQDSMRNIGQERIGQILVPLPPANEQTRIVEKLEELLSDLDAGVAELKAAQRKLARYRESLLKAAVEGALTADWRAARIAASSSSSLRKQGPSDSRRNTARSLDSRVRGNDGHEESGAALLQRILTERRARWEQKQLAKFASQGKTPPQGWQSKYSDPVAPDTTDLPSLPEGWTWATVDQLSLVQKYGSSAKTNEDSAGIPVLRMGNIQEGELDLGKLKYLPRSHDEFPDLFLEDGDLLFNRTNSPELVGKTAVFRSQIMPYSYASYLIGVRVSPRCSPDFVSAYINSTYGRQWVKSVVTQQVGQANVNGSKLAALAVPLPSEREQSEITRRLVEQRQAAFEQEAMVDRALKQAAAQRKNILKAAFAGQLVPQDPNDEPASMLLERIRAERAMGGTMDAKRGRKAKEAP